MASDYEGKFQSDATESKNAAHALKGALKEGAGKVSGSEDLKEGGRQEVQEAKEAQVEEGEKPREYPRPLGTSFLPNE